MAIGPSKIHILAVRRTVPGQIARWHVIQFCENTGRAQDTPRHWPGGDETRFAEISLWNSLSQHKTSAQSIFGMQPRFSLGRHHATDNTLHRNLPPRHLIPAVVLGTSGARLCLHMCNERINMENSQQHKSRFLRLYRSPNRQLLQGPLISWLTPGLPVMAEAGKTDHTCTSATENGWRFTCS